MADTNDRAQLLALGARCGSPRCPLTVEERLARVTAERDALRGALVALVTADEAVQAAVRDRDLAAVTPASVRLSASWAHALDVLATTGGDQ